MKIRNRKLILEQLDAKIKAFKQVANIPKPGNGWIQSIREGLHMTLRQLGKKMNISAPTLKGLERSEQQSSITLKSLEQVAEVLDMKVMYALVPKEGTLQDMVDAKAWEKAREIVNRTANTMSLEDQKSEQSRLMKAFQEKKNELKNEIPKFLWD